jgi:cytochrome-b5 reductase
MALRLPLRTRPAPLIAGLTDGAIGIAVCSKMFGTASAESRDVQKIFKGGFASVKLPLHSSEDETHDTKRLRFKLPQETAISGLPLTCEYTAQGIWTTAD